MLNIAALSSKFTVKRLCEEDADRALALFKGNPQYYRFCPPPATRESFFADLKALPPKKSYKDKYYLGFYRKDKLAAVMDLILSYPDGGTAFIGFFMVDISEQGKGLGSGIVSECAECLGRLGYEYIRLGYAKGNPQSEAFWRKNGFLPTGVEYDAGGYTVIVMQKSIK